MEGKNSAGSPKEEASGGTYISIPLSAIINFAALFALFTAILLLQNYGQKSRSAANDEKKKAPAPVEQRADDVKRPAPDRSLGRKIALSPVIKEDAPLDVAEVHLPAALEPEVALRISTENNPGKAEKSRSVTEREVTVEELDGEHARQRYMAANRGVPVPKEAPISGPAREFIPFEVTIQVP